MKLCKAGFRLQQYFKALALTTTAAFMPYKCESVTIYHASELCMCCNINKHAELIRWYNYHTFNPFFNVSVVQVLLLVKQLNFVSYVRVLISIRSTPTATTILSLVWNWTDTQKSSTTSQNIAIWIWWISKAGMAATACGLCLCLWYKPYIQVVKQQQCVGVLRYSTFPNKTVVMCSFSAMMCLWSSQLKKYFLKDFLPLWQLHHLLQCALQQEDAILP